jgi:hypothetical protein
MSEAVLSPADRVEALIVLTDRLTSRLNVEIKAFESHRPHEAAPGIKETQRLADMYRRESAQVRADPGLIAGAPVARRKRLIELTRTFEAALLRHRAAVEAARRITDGLVRTIAAVVSERRQAVARLRPRRLRKPRRRAGDRREPERVRAKTRAFPGGRTAHTEFILGPAGGRTRGP